MAGGEHYCSAFEWYCNWTHG